MCGYGAKKNAYVETTSGAGSLPMVLMNSPQPAGTGLHTVDRGSNTY